MPTHKPGTPRPKSTVRVRRVVPCPEKAKGRQTLFTPEHVEKAYKLCLLGLTDAQLADTFDIQQPTLYIWQKLHPELKKAMWEGREGADLEVVATLRQRALGYKHDSEEIKVVARGDNMGSEVVRVPIVKQYPPSEAAAIFWLKNRQRAYWRDNPDNKPGSDDVNAAARAAQEAIAAATRVVEEPKDEDAEADDQ